MSPAVNAEEREQSIDVEFRTDSDSPFRQNLLDENQITLNMDTWAIQPQGVYSGPIMAESIFEFDYEIRSNQQTSTVINTQETLFETYPMVYPGRYYGYDYELDADLSCYSAITNPDPDYEVTPRFTYPCTTDEWTHSDNSITDPYGKDDLGRIYGDYLSSPDSISFDTKIPLWGENSYHSYFSMSVPVQFSNEDIMSGASEFWVRSPIDGVYDEANSYISIFEIDSLTDIEYDVETVTILNNTKFNGEWNDPVIYNPPDMLRNTKITHDNGTLIYDNSLDGQNALGLDFSEALCATIVNGSTDADSGSDPYISSNGKQLEGDYTGANIFCPENNFPIIQSESIPVQSTQTLHLPTKMDTDLARSDWDRTYHRVNSFIYPNQPYLFVFLLEIEESNPMIAWTGEDINGPGTNTFIRYGEYNFSNPFNDDGQLQYIRNPYNHYSESIQVGADSGTSFVFTQGQSQDMAGYRFNADNTTISFMKELPEPISHSPGPDGKFDWYDGDPTANDDELDFVSIYMPFINHERKDITIEYMALAYEIQDDGDIFLKQWMNASRIDCINDTKVIGPAPFTGDETPDWDDNCGEPNAYPGVLFGKDIWEDAKHNYYYSGFWYYGYPDEGLSIKADGTGALLGYHCDDVPTGSAWGTNCRSDDFQRRAGVLNDESTNSDYFRKQYTDYFLHTSELIPENGTTHILYQFKIAGTHHWQSNIEDVCFYCDAANPFDPYPRTTALTVNGVVVPESMQPTNVITSFPQSRDSDNDGRTDTLCNIYSCQQNSTEITVLIQKPSAKPGQKLVPLPLHGVFSNTTCVSRNTFDYKADIVSDNQTTCPNTYAAPVNAWSLYQEVHDKEGTRIDGAKNQLIIESGQAWITSIGYWCGNNLMQLGYGTINAYGWNTAKPCVAAENIGSDIEYEEARGIFEINGRSASYISIEDFEFHSTELMSSVSITHGRWTEVKGASNGFDYLDNTFRHKIVDKSVYNLRVVASTYEIPECPVGYVEVDAIQCADEGDLALKDVYHDTMNVLGGIGDACNPIEITSNPTYYDVSLDWEWGACSDAIVNSIRGTAEYDWGKVIDGAQQLYGYVEDLLAELGPQLMMMGQWIAKYVVDAVGVLFSLFHEIGAHMDEIITGFLYLAGLLGLSFFLQMIVRFGATILISIERRGAA